MKEMDYFELIYILNLCGYTQKEFCQFINKSKAYLSSHIKKKGFLPYRYVQDLKKFLGDELFEYSRNKYEKSAK